MKSAARSRTRSYAPRRGPSRQAVTFHTARMGLEDDHNDLFKLMMAKGFTNVNAEQAPSGWRSYVPMLVVIGLGRR